MTMMLSEYVLRSMGFDVDVIDPTNPVTASFFHFAVSQVVGLKIDASDVLSHTVDLNLGLPTKVLLGNSVNEITQSVLSEDFADDEDTWRKEYKAQPPYLITIIGPTASYTASEGWWEEDEKSGLVTYGAFDAAKAELRALAAQATPKVHAALTTGYSQHTHSVKLKPITTAVAGRTADGKTIKDIRMHMTASGIVSSRISIDDLTALTEEAIQGLPSINTRAAEFFYNGEIEDDAVKRFLYYFIAVEILTHAAFKATDESSTSVVSAGLPAHIKQQGSDLIQRQYADLKSLADRFIWCSIVAWSNVSDASVTEMKRLKKIRDDIAHGNVSVIQPRDADAARSLALLLLRE